MSAEDSQLLSQCLAGDEQAWYRLVGLHGGLVFAVARRAGVPEHACDDIAQRVFASLSRSLGKIRNEQTLPAWLITTTKRQAWRWVKTQRSAGATLGTGAEAIGNEHFDVEDLERHAQLRRALSALEDKCRELLQLLYFVARTDYEQVSRTLGMPIGSIGPTRARCLAKLAHLMENSELKIGRDTKRKERK